jgi:glycyl-tRNA synthetase beta subunit
MMSRESLIDELKSNPTDVRGRFREIQGALEQAGSQEDLTELYKRSVHIILMTHSSPLDEKVDREQKRRRETAEREFARTVRMINRRAKKIGVEADYNENWESLATNGYETEEENLLESRSTVGIVRD